MLSILHKVKVKVFIPDPIITHKAMDQSMLEGMKRGGGGCDGARVQTKLNLGSETSCVHPS